MMEPGELRHRLTIEESEELPDAFGTPQLGWTTLGVVWGAVEPLDGRELLSARQHHATASLRIRIRYLSGLTSDCRIVLGERVFNILSIVNETERNEEMRLICAEAV